MEEAIIEIHSLQDGQEVSYLFTDGHFSKNGPEVFLEFDASDLYGKKGGVFSLKITGDDLVRVSADTGDDTEFIIERGVKHYRALPDPFGGNGLIVGIYAQHIDNDIGADGGTFAFKYILDYNNHSSVTKEMKVSVRSKKQ